MRIPVLSVSASRERRVGAAVALAGVLFALVGCGDGDSAADSTDASDTAGGSTTSTTASASGDAGAHPTFAPEDYTYRLEVLCYCPQVGALRVRVRDGEVVSATTTEEGRGFEKGAEAPDYARLTINDIIAMANDPEVDDAKVTWPAGQDHPSVVAVDRLADAVDDEVTYTIKRVRVSEE